MEITICQMQTSKHRLLGCSRNSLGTSQHKKTQAEMKVTLSEMKENLQGTISGGEVRIQINDLEYKEEKAFNQNSKKKKEF